MLVGRQLWFFILLETQIWFWVKSLFEIANFITHIAQLSKHQPPALTRLIAIFYHTYENFYSCFAHFFLFLIFLLVSGCIASGAKLGFASVFVFFLS